MEKRIIDPHVHCRDWNQSYKSTIAEVMGLAKSKGVVAICDMPNTNPPITTNELVEKRLQTAKEEGVTQGYYLFIGATKDPTQLREAFAIATNHPKVVGIKLYAGVSVGDLSIAGAEEQRLVYRIAGEEKYAGVIAAHCEEESLAQPSKWDPKRPASWNEAKPPIMEITGVNNQTKFAKEEGFIGHLHVCHVSTPEAVNIIKTEKEKMRISCGVTPHHLMLSIETNMKDGNGLMYKVNPPIRNQKTMLEMRKLLKGGSIDLIETDHAPHSLEEKTKPPFMSGIRSLETYNTLIEDLFKDGITEEGVKKLTYNNIKKIFPKIQE